MTFFPVEYRKKRQAESGFLQMMPDKGNEFPADR
jgi:hypothetical protein